MKNKDWITQLKSKLASHQEELPEGLWDEIEQSLPVQPQSRLSIFRPIRHYAAAAALLALIGGTVVLWHPWTDEDDTVTLNTTKQPVEVEEPSIEGQDSPSALPQKATEPAVDIQSESDLLPSTSVRVTPKTNKTRPEAGAQSPITESLAALVPTPSESAQTQESKPGQVLQQENPTTMPSRKQEDVPSNQLPSVNERESQILQALKSGITPKGKSQGNTFGLYAQNDLVTISTRQATGNYAMANEALFGSDDEWNSMMSPRFSKKTKHHRPYSFGLSFQHPLAKRLSLQTGLVYTQVRSDFITESPTTVVKREQVLHYVGIPLSLMYTLWQAGHFSVYVNGGGQADLNVKATLKSDGEKKDIDKDRMQFSALFGLGGQYQFTPYMGVFVEPSMRYYFDNGSEVENIFKEDPWKFNFHFGFRFNVP